MSSILDGLGIVLDQSDLWTHPCHVRTVHSTCYYFVDGRFSIEIHGVVWREAVLVILVEVGGCVVSGTGENDTVTDQPDLLLTFYVAVVRDSLKQTQKVVIKILSKECLVSSTG